MAWQYPLSATDPTETIDLSTTDNVYIAQQVVITSGNFAVRGTGSGHHAIIEGSVAGNYGILLGTNAAAAGHVVEITETGKVFSGDLYAALLYGISNTVDNAGVIKSEGSALYMSANSTTGFSTITNSGSITAGSYGILLAYCTQEIRINNTGTIKGASSLSGGDSVDKVANSGTMVGGIDLRAGDDIYDGRSGKVQGIVYGGEGSDKLYAGNEANELHGDAGKDKMFGGGGADKLYGGADADTFIFQKTAESSLKVFDTIFDFDHIDTIDLAGIDASTSKSGNQVFSYLGTSAYSHHAGELRYTKSGGNTYVHGDTNGDGIDDFSIKLVGTITMEKGDFLL
jgi:Ca2+-binding RTX toxin-like protein